MKIIYYLTTKQVNGTIEFTTYDEKPVDKCNDKSNKYYSAADRKGCNYNSTSQIDIGLFYNDVWAYKVCKQTERGFDSACETNGWVSWNAGALEGGCAIELGILVLLF